MALGWAEVWGQQSHQSCPMSAGDSGALRMRGRIPGICGALRMRGWIPALLGLALALASLLPPAGARRSQDLHCGGAGGHWDREGTAWDTGDQMGWDRTGGDKVGWGDKVGQRGQSRTGGTVRTGQDRLGKEGRGRTGTMGTA